MTDAVKMAVEREFSTLNDDVMISAKVVRSRIAAALEQAGEPVAAGEVCRECGSDGLTWFAHNRNRSQVVEGRLKTNDVECIFVLGCDACSETLRTVPADEMAAQLNEAPLPTLQRLGQEFDAGEAVEAMRAACIAAVRAEQKYEGSDFPVCNSIVHAIEQIPAVSTLAWDAEAVAWMYEYLGTFRSVNEKRLPWVITEGWTETPLYAHPPQSRVAAEPVGQDRNEAIMALTAKFGPILKAAFPNEHSRTRFDVANALAEIAIATPSQPYPQSRGQAFDGEGEGFAIGDPVEKFTGEAIWHGVIVASYLTSKGKRRYVVEVEPQGFQMIAVPSQLRALSSAKRGEG